MALVTWFGGGGRGVKAVGVVCRWVALAMAGVGVTLTDFRRPANAWAGMVTMVLRETL